MIINYNFKNIKSILLSSFNSEKSILFLALTKWIEYFYKKSNPIINYNKNRVIISYTPFFSFLAIFILYFIGFCIFIVSEVFSPVTNYPNFVKGSISVLVNIIGDSILAVLILYGSNDINCIISNINELVKKYAREKKSDIYFDVKRYNFLNIMKIKNFSISVPTLFGILFIFIFQSGLVDVPDYDLFSYVYTNSMIYSQLYIHFFTLCDSFITGYAVGLSVYLSLFILIISIKIPFKILSLFNIRGGIKELGNGLVMSHSLFIMAIFLPLVFMDIINLIILRFNQGLVTTIDIKLFIIQLESGIKQVTLIYLLYIFVLFIIPLHILHKKLEKAKESKISEIIEQLYEHESKISEIIEQLYEHESKSEVNELDINRIYYTKSLYLHSLHERISSADTWPIKDYSMIINLLFTVILIIFTALPVLKDGIPQFF